jgi:hypothetical protein
MSAAENGNPAYTTTGCDSPVLLIESIKQLNARL